VGQASVAGHFTSQSVEGLSEARHFDSMSWVLS
jgi:hypothetical protein